MTSTLVVLALPLLWAVCELISRERRRHHS